MNRRLLTAVAVVDVLIVAVAAHRYGNSGVPATVGAIALAPVGVLAAAAAGARIGGARFGELAALVYTGLPAIGAAYMLSSYRSTFLHGGLPSLLGLRSTGWLAVGILLVVALALIPQTAAAAGGCALAAWAVVHYGVGDLAGIRLGLHETAWSIAVAEWFVVAGLLGAAWRSWRLSLGLGGIIVATVLRAADHGYDNAGFWNHLGPAAPAIALLISSTVLLVPRLRPTPAPTRAH